MIDPKKRVQVYYNLHKKCWSVRQSGRVVKHTDNVMLRDVRFLVGKSGREKVLREQRKNVHAYASGYVCQVEDLPRIPERTALVTYNPYKNETFVYADNGKACLTADYAELEVNNKRPKVEGIWQ